VSGKGAAGVVPVIGVALLKPSERWPLIRRSPCARSVSTPGSSPAVLFARFQSLATVRSPLARTSVPETMCTAGLPSCPRRVLMPPWFAA
jgi:hypothetical protein